jgi:putative addiction module killer protein
MIELFRYRRDDGREPFTEWLDTVRDKVAQARIRIRLRQVQAGNFGDCEAVGGGVTELRIHLGAGYRAYIGRHGKSVVILLCGGDKRSQPADIKQAKAL